MESKHKSSASNPVEPSRSRTPINKNVRFTMVLGFLAVAAVLLLILQVNRALELRIESTEVWSEYQVKIVKASAEEDPNLRQQYTEEQDILLRHAQDLKQNGSNAKYVVKRSGYAAVILLFATAIALLGLLADSRYTVYGGLVLGLIGVAISVSTFI